jgi:hypothetical protein
MLKYFCEIENISLRYLGISPEFYIHFRYTYRYYVIICTYFMYVFCFLFLFFVTVFPSEIVLIRN